MTLLLLLLCHPRNGDVMVRAGAAFQVSGVCMPQFEKVEQEEYRVSTEVQDYLPQTLFAKEKKYSVILLF